MAKDVWNKAKLERFLKEGRGSGRFENYKPWLTLHDVSTKGRTSRLYSHKLKRMVNLFSDLQTYCFHLLEFDEQVVDIREQYPLLGLEVNSIELDAELTKKLFSDKHELQHVLTTTFLITKEINREEREIALYVKYAKDLEKKSVLQRAEIMRRYFQQLNIEFYFVTEHELNIKKAKTIASIMKMYEIEHDYPTLSYYVSMIRNELARQLYQEQEPLKAIFKRIDSQYALQTGSTSVIFKHLLARKEIVMADIAQLDFAKSVDELNIQFINGVGSE